MTKNFDTIQTIIEDSFHTNTLINLVLNDYHGNDEYLKRIDIKRILLKNIPALSFIFHYKTKDITKNYALEGAIEVIKKSMHWNGFHQLNIFSLENDYFNNLEANEKWTIKKTNPSKKSLPSLAHDKQKNRLIASYGKKYLNELNITDVNGIVLNHAQNKYKQINHYIEILSNLLKNLPKRNVTNIVDMGSGKGYLTFALYDYLTNVINLNVHILGVEFRKDLVDLCNHIAAKIGFNNLHFIESTIEKYNNEAINVLIALHACDTATDDAIGKGIKCGADLIIVAPCCHKQIRREFEKNKTINDLTFLTKYGIFLERQAEMVTDGIRALILEYFGYSTNIFEFISDNHTPKNVLIVAQKQTHTNNNKSEILSKINSTKNYFGITYHQLEKIMEI